MMPKTERFFDLAHFVLVSWAIVAVLQIALTWYLYGSPFRRDATDGPSDRSGFSLKTDYGTGCEYL